MRIEHGNIVLCLHNFGRKLWLKEKENEFYRKTKNFIEVDALRKGTEPDNVWMFLEKSPSYETLEFIVNEYSKKGKLKRYYVIRYHYREERKVGDRIAEVSEYSKKRLRRIVELFWTEDEWDMLAEITEFKY